MVEIASQDLQTLIAVGQNIVKAVNNLVAVTAGHSPTSFSERLQAQQVDGSIPAGAAALRPGTRDAPVPAMIDPNPTHTRDGGWLEFVLQNGERVRVRFARGPS